MTSRIQTGCTVVNATRTTTNLFAIYSCLYYNNGIVHVFVCVADRERSRQKNFQLILITHDMKFVEFIGRSGVVEKYSMVKKEIGLVLIWFGGIY